MDSRQFYSTDGVDDWRVLFGTWACTQFDTGSFAMGAALVQRIAELADAADHHPDVDLRYGSVMVRTFSHDVGGLTERDTALARQISSAARDLGIAADPSAVQHVQVAIDARDIASVRPFWRAVLGFAEVDDADLADVNRRGPSFWFQHTDDETRTQRGRIHIDVYVPYDQVQQRIADALTVGGRIVNDTHAPDWWTLADPEGNEVDLAIWG
jgi:4a-hydroxytetrahydrobiopterin dehydratase